MAARITLTKGQEEALTRMLAFISASEGDTFCLRGGSGCGKTRLISHFIKIVVGQRKRRVVASAPTHKACRVLRGKLQAEGIQWVFKPPLYGKSRQLPALNIVINDTIAALIGLRMTIAENQDATKEHFAISSGDATLDAVLVGSAPGYRPLLVIDETSMVGQNQLAVIKKLAKLQNAKIIFVGDEGQLPPIDALSIDFAHDFDESVELTEIVRQAEGSAIIRLAYAVRRNEALTTDLFQGPGITRAAVPIDWFLDRLTLPVDDEGKRMVFIAYTNRWVDHVQNLACWRLYQHSFLDFRVGELVLADKPVEGKVFAADQLRILQIDSASGRCQLDRVDLPEGHSGRVFQANYMSASARADPDHPFNRTLAELLAIAEKLQAEYDKATPKSQAREMIDTARRPAWKIYNDHKRRMITFVHPFAITAHRAQGSTYDTAVIHAADLLQHDRRALYVAATRPSNQLVL